MPPTHANGHISATGDPIHFMFGSRVGSADRTVERRYLRFELWWSARHCGGA